MISRLKFFLDVERFLGSGLWWSDVQWLCVLLRNASQTHQRADHGALDYGTTLGSTARLTTVRLLIGTIVKRAWAILSATH